MSSATPHLASAAAMLVLALGAGACSGSEAAELSNAEAENLVEDVLAGLDLPGVAEATDPAEIPDGELEFGFQCQIQTAGFDVDDVLVAFPPAKIGHDEFADDGIERVEVSILVFDRAASATAVLDVYDDQRAVDCLSRVMSETVDVEADDPLEAGGLSAEGFALLFADGQIQPDGHRIFATVVGRILVDVTVLAPDESRGRELAQDVLGGVVDALQAGGA